MHKIKVFLLADGVFLAVAVVFFLILFLRRGKESQFRDDLWKEKAEAKRRETEDKVDQRILLEHRPDPGEKDEPKPRPQPKAKPVPASPPPEFALPNFRGKAHEVLGIPEAANPELVDRAYKHWIKRYHPDRVTHLGATYVEQARRRAEQLNSARQALLRRKK